MVTSRLAQKEQKRLMKQTLIISGAAILVLLAFVFIILPQVIRLAANMLDGTSIGEPSDTVPPQAPIISAPVSATYSATLVVHGVGEPEAQAVVVVNSQEVGRTPIDTAGDFSLDVPLSEGENTLAFYSIDKAENESVKTQNYVVTLDTEAPSIAVEQPLAGQTIELRKNQTTEIKGSTEPHAQVFINDRLVYANAAGAFSLKYQLVEGENKLNIRAVDKAGNESNTELTVAFRI
jgi:hypothetical protein